MANDDLTLEFPHQPDLLCSLYSVFVIKEEEFQPKCSNLIEVFKNPWATSKMGIGRIKSTESLNIQIDKTKPLPKVSHYPLHPEAIQGLTPIEETITWGLVIPCTSPHNRQILPAQTS